MKKLAAVLGCVILFFCGCAEEKVQPPAVVTQVQIRCLHTGMEICRSYTGERELRTVLDCLRLQRSKGRALVDPERVMGDSLEICVYLSDGNTHIYRHRGGRFFSRDGEPWEQVDPEAIYMLYDLLWQDK